MYNLITIFTERTKKLAILLLLFITTFSSNSISAQDLKDSTFKPSGKLWGLAYGDYSYKSKADPLNRGGANQYTGISESQSFFQFRRIYLGFDYEISKTFSSNFLLASEENEISAAASSPVTSGDLLINNKIAPFVKFANITWKNIFRGSNLSMGQMSTPVVVLSEIVWDYRCIERTVADIRRTPTYDLGARLNGTFINTNKNELGYTVMVGNGTGARPENDRFKWFYGDLYAKLFNKKLIVDLYSDYNRINWMANWHHDRNMVKLLLAYTTPRLTVGVESFMNNLRNDNIATKTATGNDTLTTRAYAISLFAHGKLYKDVLGFFIRYDNYDPTHNNNNSMYSKYAPAASTFDPNTREQFFTIGLDYTPISKVHIMPNVWYNAYNNAGPLNVGNGYDLVYRLSLYYVYGK